MLIYEHYTLGEMCDVDVIVLDVLYLDDEMDMLYLDICAVVLDYVIHLNAMRRYLTCRFLRFGSLILGYLRRGYSIFEHDMCHFGIYA